MNFLFAFLRVYSQGRIFSIELTHVESGDGVGGGGRGMAKAVQSKNNRVFSRKCRFNLDWP